MAEDRHGVTIPLPALDAASLGGLLKQLVFYLVFAVAAFMSGHHFGGGGGAVPSSPAPERVFPAPVDPPSAAQPAAPKRKAAWIEPEASQGVLTIPCGRGRSCQCTGTFLLPQPREGEYWFLSAAHCAPRAGVRGQVVSRATGGRYECHVLARHPGCDLLLGLVRTDDALPCASVASMEAEVGEEVWHCGFGQDRPGNTERGHVRGGPGSNGQCSYALHVSHGDSGAGIFLAESGYLVGVVASTDFRGTTHGAGVTAVNRLVAELTHDVQTASRFGNWLRRLRHRAASLLA